MLRLIISAIILFTTASINAADQTKTYNNTGFNEVSVCCGMKLRVNQSDTYSIKITADQKDFEYLKVEQKDNSLRIYINKNNYRIRKDIRVEISMPDLNSLSLSGGALGNLIDINTKNTFNADLSGGAQLIGNLKCGDLEADLSGGSKVNLKGSGRNIELNGSGGSIFELSEFEVKDVQSQLSGGSNVKIKMNGTLNTSQSGGSQLVFYGTAKIGRTSFSGGSGVSKGD
jgi:hypothetical protein